MGKRKSIFVILLFLFSLRSVSTFTHIPPENAVEIAVKVYDGDSFVENLTINDFEVFEDGEPCNLKALCLVKEGRIRRIEGIKKFSPSTSRTFYLYFDISELNSKVEQAVDYFINNLLLADDNLIIITPVRAYKMKKYSLDSAGKKTVLFQLRDILKKDSFRGNVYYKRLVKEIIQLTDFLSGKNPKVDRWRELYFARTFNPTLSRDELLVRYSSLLASLEKLRKVEQERILEIARMAKSIKGQKIVFFFYQREPLPQIEISQLRPSITEVPSTLDMVHSISYLKEFFQRDLSFDEEAMIKDFSDSSTTLYFLFFTRPDSFQGRDKKFSSNIFATFDKITQGTGGLGASSLRPDLLIRKVRKSIGNYYLLYYTTQSSQPYSKFRRIKIKTKQKGFRIIHRTGYYLSK